MQFLWSFVGKKNGQKKIEAELPNWLKESRSHSIIKTSGEILDPLVIIFIGSITKNLDKVMPNKEELDQKINEVIDEKVEKVKPTESFETKVDRDAGYNKKDIQKMDRLIEIIDKK